MKKYPDRYFDIDEWAIVETGFNKEYSKVSESVFSLGNEYMGVRGNFDEGYSGDSLVGSYFNGVFERQYLNEVHYKGVEDTTEFMVNSVNWLHTRIVVDGEELDLNTSDISDFKRALNMKNGILSRSFIWHTKGGKEIMLQFERFVSMVDVNYGLQKVTITALNSRLEADLYTGLDFGVLHQVYKQNYWNCENQYTALGLMSITGETISTKIKVKSSAKIYGDFTEVEDIIDSKKVGKRLKISANKNEKAKFIKVVKNISQYKESDKNSSDFKGYEALKSENKKFWIDVWNKSDIDIVGDDLNQQGIRYCIFQMYQTFHGAIEGTNIGAKGLTGESYNGNAFWDTEVYCLPFYIFNNITAARNLIMFRYQTLSYAKERAKELDCSGAFYPIATIRGKECCNLWQHSNLQLQASTGVAYAIWMYVKTTKDYEFLHNYGITMLIEISKMLASRGDFTKDNQRYGYYGVMGPDEFQMMVNNNFYTNYMGKFVLSYTSEVLNNIKSSDDKLFMKILADNNISADEISKWENISDKMYLGYDKDTKLYEQHEGYYDLPNVDIKEIPVDQFPLYHNWSYDRIYRNNMIKQPDVLMVMLMFNSQFSHDVLLKNYEYYEPKCIHESSLSPSVHSILAEQLEKHEEAYKFFEFATRMDLDNYNRNTDEGLHITSIAAAWMNIVYGFAGMRSDGDMLKFNPYLPDKWKEYSFRISYRDNVIFANIKQQESSFKLIEGESLEVCVFDEKVILTKNETTFNMKTTKSGT